MYAKSTLGSHLPTDLFRSQNLLQLSKEVEIRQELREAKRPKSHLRYSYFSFTHRLPGYTVIVILKVASVVLLKINCMIIWIILR